ncbi:MAG: aminoglycoside phosphotransferase [Gallionellales bacterium GWA2_55_18]|nr:MAG: aminoglycoside phosphotransferase [Gallionellales bacterium GWA2_55_18]
MLRQQQLTKWLESQFPNETFTISPASADASFRRYFRATFADGNGNTLPAKSLIVMDAPPQHENCRPFLHVAKLFEKAGTHVPHVYAQDLQQGFLLLSDLGNTTYLQALSASTARDLYGAATDALIKIQLASRENELPPYDEALLLREMRLFPEWYIAKHLNVTLTDKQHAKLEEVFARIITNNLAQPRVYVHRDYHSRNLMYIERPLLNPLPEMPSPQSSPASERGGERERQSLIPAGEEANEKRGKQAIREADARKSNFLTSPGILDFQDALYGPITYDLVSLFKDAYIKWEEAEIIDWLIRYWEKARKAGLPVAEDFSGFYRDYEWMGVQRHLKVLGIFARLYHRDSKDGYLKDLPLVMAYLRAACARYIDLKPLLNLLDELEPHGIQEGYTF